MIATVYPSAPMRRTLSLPVTLAVALVVAGCGGGSSSSSTSSTKAASKPSSGCKQVPEPKPRHVKLKSPPVTVKTGEKLTADVATSCGSFQISLDTGNFPKTVNSFVYLAKRGFYNGLDFQRVVPQFVVQGGDPLGTGAGGPGYTVVEAPPSSTSYRRGVVAMAKTAVQPPGASGSQFFVVTAPADAGLPADYAVLGKVTSGMDSVERIAHLANPALGPQGGPPRQPVVIDKITVH
jgi:cyclophilin family peptidyl-prolyl cis-trans isomerase